MKSKLRKTIMNLLLVLCMAVSMFSINVFAEDSNSTDVVADSTGKIDECETVIKEYSEKEAKSYLAGDNTYPTLDGYRFAGWYTDKVCSKNTILGSKTPNGTTYALFVPEHVLSIKAQVSVNLINDDKGDDTKASLRFITSVDSLLYKEVGFEVTYEGTDGKTRKATSASNKVYSSLYECGSEEVWEKKPADVFCNLSKYFKICTLKEFTMATYEEITFTVTPYWITADGAKVYGVPSTKTFVDGTLREEAWVSTSGSNTYNYGSKANPYQTLDFALTHIQNGGKVHLINEVSINGDTDWPEHGKTNVTITEGILNVTTDDLYIADGVTFSNMELKIADTEARTWNRIFAEGNHVVIAEDVTVSNQEATVQIFGGKELASESVENTNLEVYAGTYSGIYGGGSAGIVTGDVNLSIGAKASANAVYGGGYFGKVSKDVNITVIAGMNANADYTNHSATTYQMFGGGELGTVGGDVNITVKEDAKFNYIYGGGKESAATVAGTITTNFAGKAYGIYGGGLNGANGNTRVVMTGGEVYQIFGGHRKLNMEGYTDVQVLGGTVHRRIYGGSYNDYVTDIEAALSDKTEGWQNQLQVNGYTSVTIGQGTDTELNLTLNNIRGDNALSALSRYDVARLGEWGALIFQDDLYDTYKDKIMGALDTTSNPSYHYLVKASKNGEVYSAGDYLSIEPDNGYAATVYQVVDGVEVEKHYTVSDGYWKLPGIDSPTDKTEIRVKFTEPNREDFTGYQAKINEAYYTTLEEAIAAADKYKDAEIEDLGAEKRLVKVTVKDSQFGTITTDKEYCLMDETVTIKQKELLNNAYYLAGLKVNDNEYKFNEDGTYSFTAELESYEIEGIYKKAIFAANDNWDLSEQYQGEKDGVTSGVVSIPGDTQSWLYLYENVAGVAQYGDIDITFTLKDFGDALDSSAQIKFSFKTENDGQKDLLLWLYPYNNKMYLKQEEQSTLQIGSSYICSFDIDGFAEDGFDIRIRREGTKLMFYVDGVFKKSIQLTGYIENDTLARICIMQAGDASQQVSIPYELSFPEKKVLGEEGAKYVSILGDEVSMSSGEPARNTNNTTVSSSVEATDIYGIYSTSNVCGIGEDYKKLYWGQSLDTYGMELLVNNSVCGRKLATDQSENYSRTQQLHADTGTLQGTNPDIIYLYMGVEDVKQTSCSTFATMYEATLKSLTETYKDAEIFCFTVMSYYDGGYRGIGCTTGSSASKMTSVNTSIRDLASKFENVTLVDIADIINTGNYTDYFKVANTADKTTTPEVKAHNEIAEILGKVLESQFKAPETTE